MFAIANSYLLCFTVFNIKSHLPMQILSRFEYTVMPTTIPIMIIKTETKIPTTTPPLSAVAENKQQT